MRKQKLINVLREMEPDALVKIGTVGGSGWIYAGTAAGYRKESAGIHARIATENNQRREAVRRHLKGILDEGMSFEQVTDKCKSEAIIEWANHMTKTARRYALAEKTIEDFKRLADRAVVEIWEDESGNETNILVNGIEGGDKYTADEYTPITYEDMDTAATNRMISAMYTPLLTNLRAAYYELLKHGSTTKNRSAVKKTEREIRRDPYGLFSDGGEGIIKACRDAAEKRLEQERKEAEKRAKRGGGVDA